MQNEEKKQGDSEWSFAKSRTNNNPSSRSTRTSPIKGSQN